MEKISSIIKEKGLRPSDCAYHTLRALENGGKIRILVVKGDKTAHVEYVCPQCRHYAYATQEWKEVSKAAKIRASVKCARCGYVIKVEKMKGGKKPKMEE
ncbi:MAG: hypothetical protein QXU82_01220 [Candidatus Aenigmatarchaeota archaeon]